MSGLDANMLKPLYESNNEVIELALSEFEENSKG